MDGRALVTSGLWPQATSELHIRLATAGMAEGLAAKDWHIVDYIVLVWKRIKYFILSWLEV